MNAFISDWLFTSNKAQGLFNTFVCLMFPAYWNFPLNSNSRALKNTLEVAYGPRCLEHHSGGILIWFCCGVDRSLLLLEKYWSISITGLHEAHARGSTVTVWKVKVISRLLHLTTSCFGLCLQAESATPQEMYSQKENPRYNQTAVFRTKICWFGQLFDMKIFRWALTMFRCVGLDRQLPGLLYNCLDFQFPYDCETYSLC